MGIGELIAISIGVSMDAFAIAICKGLSVEHVEPKHLLSAGLWVWRLTGGHAPAGLCLGQRFPIRDRKPGPLDLLYPVGGHRNSYDPGIPGACQGNGRVFRSARHVPSGCGRQYRRIGCGRVLCVFEGRHPSGHSHDWIDNILLFCSWCKNRQSFWSQIQIQGRSGGRNRIASHGDLDFSGAFVGVMKGECVWQTPILQSVHWQLP